MEKLILKSNRSFIVKIILFALIPISLLTIITLIGCFFAENLRDILWAFIVSLTFTIILLIFLLCVIFVRKTTFIFTKEDISIMNKEENKININDVVEMVYYSYKWWYIFTSIFSSLPKGGCMKIHIKDKSNNKHILGFFSYKDALKIKNLYPNLMTIE